MGIVSCDFLKMSVLGYCCQTIVFVWPCKTIITWTYPRLETVFEISFVYLYFQHPNVTFFKYYLVCVCDMIMLTLNVHTIVVLFVL